MSIFNGILNDNGHGKKIKLCINLEADKMYNTDLYIDDIYDNAVIESDMITIQNRVYNYCTKKCDDEIIITGKEKKGVLHCLLPCIYKQIFFVLTNKETV